MKDILVQYYVTVGFIISNPRKVIRKTFKLNLVSDYTWMEMLKVKMNLYMITAE